VNSTVEKQKTKKIVLGAESTPLPVWDSQTGRTGALASPESGIDFYTLNEKRDAQSIYADLMRNLPSRSMLPQLIHELTERDPGRVDWDKHSFLCGYMGPPSIGKSFMIKTIGRLVHPRGCLYLNCKDIDMGTIFCETVFDTSSANKEKASIDAKILQGNQGGEGLSDDSLHMLRNALGDAFIEEERDGKKLISIDWNGIQVKGTTPEEQAYQKQVIHETMSQVCQNEHIVMSSEMGQIGITTRDGIAIRAADPKSADYGRPILLDEINRAKPGTLQKLYEFFAMLSDPKVERQQVTGGENRPFTFSREDLPVTYRMNFTGNPATQGMGSADMDRPLISRFGVELDIRTVPDPALADYADRIAQSLTGVPLMQVYYSARPFFDKHPEKLVEAAKNFRLQGLSEAEKHNVPEEEMLNIEDAMRIMQLSEQLAEFFGSLKTVFNPESPAYRSGKFSISQEYETYLQGLEVDLRLVSKLLEKASVVTPRVLQPGAVDYSAAFSKAADKAASADISIDDRLADRGQRLESYLLQWLHDVLIPADAQTRGINVQECDKVLKFAATIAAHCGIGKLSLQESMQGGVQRIGELYDIDKLQTVTARHALLRDLMVDVIRQHSDGLPEDPDQVLSVSDAAKALALAAKTTLAEPAVFVAGSTSAEPFKAVVATNDNAADGKPLASKEAFLTALAIPELREKTINGLWNPAMLDDQNLELSDEAAKIAANTSDSGLAVTTVLVDSNGKDEPVHIFRAAATETSPEKVVVVSGSDVDKRLKALLKSGGVTYVDSNDIDAVTTVNEAVKDCLNDGTDRNIAASYLSTAFLIRNGAAGQESSYAEKTLGELMTIGKNIESPAPLRITMTDVAKKKAARRAPRVK
jgi:hypothetical protein